MIVIHRNDRFWAPSVLLLPAAAWLKRRSAEPGPLLRADAPTRFALCRPRSIDHSITSLLALLRLLLL
jgi:hypothetical protein